MSTVSIRQGAWRLTGARVTAVPWPCWAALSCGLLAVLATPLDQPLAAWVARTSFPSELLNLLLIGERFGHGFGAAVIVVAVWTLHCRRRLAMRIAACAAFSGLAASVLKVWIGRVRPNAGHLPWPSGFWLRLGEGPFDYVTKSFPSGHAATAVGLAVGLTWLFPRGRWLFAALALLTAVQRLQSGAHYLSDVLAGAALALLISTLR